MRACLAAFLVMTPENTTLHTRAGAWIAECNGPKIDDCFITVHFQKTNVDGTHGAFALVLGRDRLAIVGKPDPIRAKIQVDRNNPIQCSHVRYCIFRRKAAVQGAFELATGSLVLISVQTSKEVFRFSLTTAGYHAVLAKLEAEGYQIEN